MATDQLYAKVIILGEAPGPRGDPTKVLEGRAGHRLATLCGISYAEYLTRFQRVNLLERWPGVGKGKGSAWDAAAADGRWQELAATLTQEHLVVVLGYRVWASVSALRPAFFVTQFPWDPNIPGTILRTPCILAPHPSGVNHWWNDTWNVVRARRFWAKLAKDAGAFLPLPAVTKGARVLGARSAARS